METGKISASLIQRRFRLGYNRAARIIDLLEERGMIGPQNGSKPREVLMGGNSDEEN
jgi:S-DNA-T family DNA segregation ATPase FtsK/SpoIIIE